MLHTRLPRDILCNFYIAKTLTNAYQRIYIEHEYNKSVELTLHEDFVIVLFHKKQNVCYLLSLTRMPAIIFASQGSDPHLSSLSSRM